MAGINCRSSYGFDEGRTLCHLKLGGSAILDATWVRAYGEGATSTVRFATHPRVDPCTTMLNRTTA